MRLCLAPNLSFDAALAAPDKGVLDSSMSSSIMVPDRLLCWAGASVVVLIPKGSKSGNISCRPRSLTNYARCRNSGTCSTALQSNKIIVNYNGIEPTHMVWVTATHCQAQERMGDKVQS